MANNSLQHKILTYYSRTSMARKHLGPWTFALDIDSSSHYRDQHGFSCINIRQVPRTSVPPDLANGNALKNHVRSLLLHKNENICYISRYFLHYFVSLFHRCLANAISTDYVRSRAGQYTSRNGSKSVAPVRSY